MVRAGAADGVRWPSVTAQVRLVSSPVDGGASAGQARLTSCPTCGPRARASEGADDELILRPGQVWASAEQLARRYDMSVKWIHKHRVEFGAVRVSPEASNSKWKFHVETADAWMVEQRVRPAAARRGPRRAAAKASSAGSRSFRR